MKKFVLIICVTFMLGFVFSGFASANDFGEFDFTADCEGFKISGTACAGWSFHDGFTITYDFDVNGTPVVGSSTTNVESDIFECIPFEITGAWQEEFCGDVVINGTVSVASSNFPGQGNSVVLDVSPFFCPCGCTRTPGYYKKADNWPAGVEALSIGGVEYSKDFLVDYLKKPVRGDLSVKLRQHLIAAMLNVINEPSNNTPLIQMYIDAANAYFTDPADCDKYCVEEMKDMLDEFNNSGEYWCDMGEDEE